MSLCVFVPALAGVLTFAGLHQAAADTARAGQNSRPNVPCTCRYNGQDFGIGDTICLKAGSDMRLATCSMVLNNTSWKMSTTPCPQAFFQRDEPMTEQLKDRTASRSAAAL